MAEVIKLDKNKIFLFTDKKSNCHLVLDANNVEEAIEAYNAVCNQYWTKIELFETE